jgi:hypothetical protein
MVVDKIERLEGSEKEEGIDRRTEDKIWRIEG